MTVFILLRLGVGVMMLHALPPDGRDPCFCFDGRVVREGQLLDDPAAGRGHVAVAVLFDDADDLLGVVLEALVGGRVGWGCVESEPLGHRGRGIVERSRGRVRGHGGVVDGGGAVDDLGQLFAEGLVYSGRQVERLVDSSIGKLEG